VVVGLLESGNELSLIAEPFGRLFQRHPRGQHGFQSRAQLRVHVCNNRLAVLPPPTSAALSSVIGIVGIATPRLLFGLLAGVCGIALVIATAAASIAPSRIASRLITGVALFAVRITTANSTAVTTTGIAGIATTGIAGVSTTGITGIATTGIAGVSTTGITGIATTGIAGVSTTGIAGIATTRIAGVSTTGTGIATTGFAGVSTTGLPSRCRYLATG
jgi:hypothetical protein